MRFVRGVILLAFVLLGATNAVSVGVYNPKTLKPAREGDLFTVQNGKPTRRLTWWGYNAAPIVSRNGRFGVYQSQAQESLRNRDCGCAPNPPDLTNLYLIDLKTLSIKKITRTGLYRSAVLWNPRSQSFVWLENGWPRVPNTFRLRVYTIDGSGTRTLLEGIPGNGCACVASVPDLRWTPKGVLISSDPNDDGKPDCYLADVSRGASARLEGARRPCP